MWQLLLNAFSDPWKCYFFTKKILIKFIFFLISHGTVCQRIVHEKVWDTASTTTSSLHAGDSGHLQEYSVSLTQLLNVLTRKIRTSTFTEYACWVGLKKTKNSKEFFSYWNSAIDGYLFSLNWNLMGQANIYYFLLVCFIIVQLQNNMNTRKSIQVRKLLSSTAYFNFYFHYLMAPLFVFFWVERFPPFTFKIESHVI